MVTATTWLFQAVGYHQGAPILFSGVGIGILISAELIAGADGAGLRSAADWSILGAVSAVAWAFALLRVGGQPDVLLPDQADFRDPIGQSERPIAAWMLILVYGLAGFGYIVTATYLPLCVKHSLRDIDPLQVWAALAKGIVWSFRDGRVDRLVNFTCRR